MPVLIRTPTFVLAFVLAFSAASPALAAETTLTDAELEALIDRRIDARLRALGLEDDDIDVTIERGIRAFVDRQRARNNPSAMARNARPVSVDDDHIYGNPQAIVSLIEYSDFECPYCKVFHATARQIVDAYGGRVNWVYRHFPLAFHNPGAQEQAEASECAAELGGNEAFWRYTDLIYARTTSNGTGFPIENLVPLAVEIGLNETAFADCLSNDRQAQRVLDDFSDGQRAGVTGTPGNILRRNDTAESIALAGAVPYDQVKRIVDRLLSAGTSQ